LLSLTLLAPVASEDLATYDRLLEGVAAAWDSSRGGFVSRDGLPSQAAIQLALLHGAERGDPAWTRRGLATLDWTIGLHDSVGGGFFTRARDADPFSTSFDKMTVPNAQRLEMLIVAWRLTGEARYRTAAARVVDYGERVLLDGRGGFVHGQVGDRQLVPESNGEMLRAWLLWGGATSDPRRRDFAWKSLDRVWASCWSGLPGLVRRGDFDHITSAPLLQDQVDMGRAYLWAAHLAGRAADLERAMTVADTMLRAYADPKGGFRTRALANKKGIVRNAPREPVENARAARFLAELAAVTGEPRYREAARRTVAAFAKELEKKPRLEGAEWALALRAITTPDLPERIDWKTPPKATRGR
jgi:uncharacterized protein YyaL (SSP411 family)